MSGRTPTLHAASSIVSERLRPVLDRRRVAFVFPGQGSQWPGMGRELARQEPVFRRALERCAGAIRQRTGWCLWRELRASPDTSRLDETDVVQPALFAIQVALAALWRSWGIEPTAVLGQSLGEVAACHVAGILSLDDATRVICSSSEQFRALGGAMLVVEESAEALRPVLTGAGRQIHLAIHTSPRSTVLSGGRRCLEALAENLAAAGVFCRFVDVGFACHNPNVAAINHVLRRQLADLEPRRAEIDMWSTVTGERLAGREVDADYWCRNWSRPVLFRQGVEGLAAAGVSVFVELSPHPLLVGAVREVLRHARRPGIAVSSLRRGGAGGELAASLQALRRAEDGSPAAADPLEVLRRRAAQVLRRSAGELDSARSLPEQGLDSLLAVELRHLLEKDLGVALSTTRLLAEDRLAEVASHLAPPVPAGRRAASTGETPRLRRIGAASDEHPLSAGQKALWFLHRLAPENPAYHVPLALAFDAAPETAALRRALQQLTRRHRVLRARFRDTDGEPVQCWCGDRRLDFGARDARDWSAAQLDAALQREVLEPFDLTSQPPFRARLYRRSPAAAVLLLVTHHIATDFWSLSVLLRDLAALLAAESRGAEPPFEPLRVDYGDYARWQARWLGSPAASRELDYWRQRLSDPPPPLELPVDRQRPAVRSGAGASCAARLGARPSESLNDFARRSRTTVFVPALAALQALLQRWTGQDDLMVGSPMAGRDAAVLADVVGYFANPVVLRADLSADPTGVRFLERSRREVLGAMAHQLAPFPWLVDGLEPRREVARSAFFDVMLVQEKGLRAADQSLAASFVGHCGPPIELGGTEALCLPLGDAAALFDLTLRLAEVEGEQILAAQYSAELFDEATIRRFLGHYRELLRGLVAAPESRLSELPWLSAAERQQLLVEWTAAVDSPSAGCLHELFAAQAARSPDAVAAVCGQRMLSYRELERRARRVAKRLADLGAAAERRIGLCVERGLDLLVGLLGILRSGAAYVPLDPAYPSARLRRIAEASGLSVLVTEAGSEDCLGPQAATLPRLRLAAAASPVAEPAASPIVRSRPEHAAYCIYTSGSTGRPKGAVVTHSAVTRLFRATAATFDFTADDVWTMVHSCGFDFSVWEMWGAWLHGGRLVVVPHPASRAPDELRRLLAREAVTVLSQTPSAFSQLASVPAKGAGRLALRWVVLGGEALDFQALGPWLASHGDRRPALVNMYGLTEATVHVTRRRVRRVDLEARPAGDVGRAIADLAAPVLDRSGRPVAIGVIGELAVGGAGLARGYLEQPAATAERFVPDPRAAARPGERLYRTGDRVRQRPDGSLDYLGRFDDQVQLRGFRVEPAEIERVLCRDPSVDQAVVVVRRDGFGEPRLVAYVAIPEARDGAARVRRLQEALARQLPDYMRPASVISLQRLPLTAHGKVDRGALPAPSRQRPELAAYRAPETALERLIAAVWCEVLELDDVGTGDSFFEAGGHSLLLTRVQRRLASRGHDVAIVDLLRYATIQSLAQYLSPSDGSPPATPWRAAESSTQRPPRGAVLQQRRARRRHRAAARGAAGD